jgi:molybdate transport system substrate-binding protein
MSRIIGVYLLVLAMFGAAAATAAGASSTGPDSVRAAALRPPVHVAIAANFAVPFAQIAAAFTAATGQQLTTSTGSTAQLAAQISNGAPFAVFLAADTLQPRALERAGHAVRDTRFVYAVGRLVLWSADSLRIGADGRAALAAPDVRHLAIANPKIAPYGLAAVQVLRALGLYDALTSRLVQGENVAQALQFVESGNAQLGFVALSQVRDPRLAGRGSAWLVPAALHAPILQEAVLLERGAQQPGARALLLFLRGPEALAVIERFGYGLP